MAQYINFAQKVATTQSRIDNSKISTHNKKILARFREYMEGKGLSLARIDRALDIAKIIAESLEPKKLDKVTKNDIIKLVGEWEKAKNVKTGKPWTAWTKATYKQVLKVFYRWLLGKNGLAPEQVSWFSTAIKRSDSETINVNDLFSEDDVKKLIDSSDDVQTKAFIGCLYDSAARPEEFVTLNIGDVVIDGTSVKMRVNRGKQGQRYVHLTLFAPLLVQWLNIHPAKNNKNAPIWTIRSNNNRGQGYTYAGARNMFKEACLRAFFPDELKAADTKKKKFALIKTKLQGRRWTMYNLRHSRATQLVKLGIAIPALQRHMGHSKLDRTMVYTHLDDHDTEIELMRAQGTVGIEEIKQESQLKPIKCSRCEEINDATKKFCGRCGNALRLETALEMQDEQTAFLKEKILAEQKFDRNELRQLIKEELAKKKG